MATKRIAFMIYSLYNYDG